MSGRLPRAAPEQPGDGLRILSSTPTATRTLGRWLGLDAQPGTLVLLQGDLGSGKTVLAQGLARGLGVPGGAYVNSPSYTYVREHQGRCSFYHVDLYRIADPEEIELIGLRELFDGRSVCAVEWPERAREWLPAAALHVRFGDAAVGRVLELSAVGARAQQLVSLVRGRLAG